MPIYQIADLLVRYDPQYPMLNTRSEQYRTAETTDAAAWIGADAQTLENLHQIHPNLSLEECEYMQAGREFFTLLLSHDGMMLHASAVVVDGAAYLFSAPSGTGKSTHTALWLKKFGDGAFLLNDDKPALRILDGKVYAYGAPFSGKFDLSVNVRMPVQGIAFIERSETNRIVRKSGKDALYALLNQTVRPREVPLYTKLLQIIQTITEQIPIYTLYCNMDPQAADLSYEVMRKGNEDED